MRVVSAFYHFCRNTMHWIRTSALYFWGRFWELARKTGLGVLCFIVLRFAPRLLWRNKDGNEPGASDENRRRVEDLETGVSGEGGWSPRKTTYRTDGNEHGSEHETNMVTGSSDDSEEEANEGEEWPEEEDFDGEEYRVETTDELYCEYDSTWETDPGEEIQHRRTRTRNHYNFSRFERAARDMQNYRKDYPNQINPQQWIDDKPNLKFYLGETPSVPDGVYITDFHNDWYRDYDRLEAVHTFIQWLFPLQEPGMNYEASTLTKEEMREFCDNSTAKKNLLESYKLMLDFYGIELCDEETGEVKRAANWEDRFNNLNSHTHNNLRITRILKCLGNLGFPHYQAPLVRFFLKETLVKRQLPSMKDSVLSYFMFAVLDKRQRRNLIKYAYLKYKPKDAFVWCPKKIQVLWSEESKHRKKSHKKRMC